jgi:hypothetical protein
MSNIDKIRQKIERLKGYISVTHFAEELLSFIDSLQQEQPSEDLEKEMERFLSNITPAFKDGSYKITRYGFRAVARHFAEWQKQQMLKDAMKGMITCANLNRYILVPKLDESLTYGDKVKIVIIPDKEDKE